MSHPENSRYPNRLITTASPYLLQHAYNPVNWFPWGPEALEKALKEDKPILVSIGYSTCHWCHVMESESFEDEAVAAYMNEHFVTIKVDREERPDIDQLYMEAVQMISGSGGWPLNCFLTPDGRPFYGGTYFPSKPGYNRPSWTQLLQHLVMLYQEKRPVVEEQANRLVEAIRNQQTKFIALGNEELVLPNADRRSKIDKIFQRIMEERDLEYGGFGAAPKFPRTMSLEFLLTYYHYTGVESAKDHVLFSLQKMIRGGIYDHVGGGFARYTTDKKWLVPHFEKMLYDNALLVDLMSKWCRIAPDQELEKGIHETISFFIRELSHPMGGFYAALDADSEGEEGKFYVWPLKEFKEVCGTNWKLWADYLQVTEAGNWEGTNILHRSIDDHTFAAKHGMTVAALHIDWQEIQAKLLFERTKRVRPGLDDKVILGWNGLAIQAILSAYRSFGNPEWLALADRTLHFVKKNMVQPTGGFYRIYGKGAAYQDAFLEDYAFYIRAVLERLQIDFEPSMLEDIQLLLEWVIEHFYDDEFGVFKTSRSRELVSPLFDIYDGALPAGNAIMISNAYSLSVLTGKQRYSEIADRLLRKMESSVEQFPGTFTQYASCMAEVAFERKEIVVAGEGYKALLNQVLGLYQPGTVIVGSDAEEGSPLLQERVFPEKTYLYLCRGQTCHMPVEDLSALLSQL